MELFGIPVEINPQCAFNIWALTKEATEHNGREYSLLYPSSPIMFRRLKELAPIRLEMSQELYDRAKGVEGG